MIFNEPYFWAITYFILSVGIWFLTLRDKKVLNFCIAISQTLWTVLRFSEAGFFELSTFVYRALNIISIVVVLFGIINYAQSKNRR